MTRTEWELPIKCSTVKGVCGISEFMLVVEYPILAVVSASYTFLYAVNHNALDWRGMGAYSLAMFGILWYAIDHKYDSLWSDLYNLFPTLNCIKDEDTP